MANRLQPMQTMSPPRLVSALALLIASHQPRQSSSCFAGIGVAAVVGRPPSASSARLRVAGAGERCAADDAGRGSKRGSESPLLRADRGVAASAKMVSPARDKTSLESWLLFECTLCARSTLSFRDMTFSYRSWSSAAQIVFDKDGKPSLPCTARYYLRTALTSGPHAKELSATAPPPSTPGPRR